MFPVAPHPVDARLPPLRLLLLATQHVLTMYAASITGPLILGSSLHLATGQTAYLVSSGLVACGLATLVQCIGFGPVGLRWPVMMGVTFVAIGPAIAIASDPALGLAGVFGATIVSGMAGVLIAPVFTRALRFFTPVVTGTTLLIIGLSLIEVAVRWAAGSDSSGVAQPASIAVASLVVACILAILRFGRGMFANMAVLIGILIGFAATCLAGWVNLAPVTSAKWFHFVAPLHFGVPTFNLVAAATMTVVMLVTMVESTGMFSGLARIVDLPLDAKELARGLRADAVGGVVGGLFNSLSMTSYSQNIAIVGMTGVRSRFVCATAGAMMIVLGSAPKLAFLVTAIPLPVLGGAALVMFGMVAAHGIQIIGRVDLSRNRNNLYIVAIGLCVGLIPTVDARFFEKAPASVAPFAHSGILLGVVTLVALNFLLNGAARDKAADGEENAN